MVKHNNNHEYQIKIKIVFYKYIRRDESSSLSSQNINEHEIRIHFEDKGKEPS